MYIYEVVYASNRPPSSSSSSEAVLNTHYIFNISLLLFDTFPKYFYTVIHSVASAWPWNHCLQELWSSVQDNVYLLIWLVVPMWLRGHNVAFHWKMFLSVNKLSFSSTKDTTFYSVWFKPARWFLFRRNWKFESLTMTTNFNLKSSF